MTEAVGQLPHFRSKALPLEYANATPTLLLEASDGLFWVGTSSGVFEYNGLEYHPILSNDTLLNVEVTALFEDLEKRIWIGTRKGDIYHFDTTKKLQQWQPEEGTPAVPITGFIQTEDSTFWISTYGEGLYYLRNERLYNINEEDGLPATDIYHLAQHRSDHVLASTDAGIAVCKIKNGEKIIHQLGRTDGLRDEITKTTLSDNDGNFYVGTYDQGIDYWTASTQNFQPLISQWLHGEITCLEKVDQEELWIGTNGHGLFRYTLETKTLDQIADPLFTNAKIHDIHCDTEGNIWVVSNTSDIQIAHRSFEQLSHQLGNSQAVLVDQSNQLWVGTANGLFFLDDHQFVNFNLGKSVNVISLYQDTYGQIWIGTFGQGLFCLNQETKQLRFFSKEDGLLNANILSIDGSETYLWLSTLGGVFELDLVPDILKNKVNFRNYTNDDGLGTDFIYKVYVDRKGRTWFGTDGKGLSVLENGKITNYPIAHGQLIRAVYAITEDQRGHLWFSTAEQGLFEFDGQEFYPLNLQTGMRELSVTSLATDPNGNILIAHSSGIDLLDPVSRHLIYYDSEVGLNNLEPALNAISKDAQGNIYLGANNSIIRYKPASIPLEIHPRTVIRQVRVFFEPIDFHSIMNLDHNENSLIFEYIGLWYTAPEKVTYRYKLEGYDPEWIYSKDQQANYSSLPSGKYTFRVEAAENRDFKGVHEAIYTFTIGAPFWQRWWFITIISLFIITAIIAWGKWKSNRLQRAAQLQRERVESQMEVLKSQINPHFLFNSFNTLLSLIEEDSESAAEYVEHLSDFYRSLLAYRQKDLIPLQEELNLLRNFYYLLQKRFNDSIWMEIPEINGRPVFIPPLTLQMLVENAIKHNVVSKSKPLNITLTVSDHSIVVRNNLQKKLTPEKSTHFGLQSIRSRYELLDKPGMQVEVTEAEFIVTLPIINNS
jgi:ligand-binding sensor domain-containing protein